MMTPTMSATANNDAELVAASLSGNRDAFGQIVARYQSLICSLAYSATGSLGQSEDIAQETFITAWKRLGHLREQHKLRAWLCGIARNRINNALRRDVREPVHTAAPLETVHDSVSPEPLPHDQAIGKEEEAILWRSLERIPELYREPLVLFYREHQSIETVATALELSEDAVKQRLSRGRKLLHEQVLAFVEGALARTNPGKAFAIGVLASLPALTISAQAATMGAVAVKGSTAAKTAVMLGFTGAILSPILAVFGNYIGYRINMNTASSEAERSYIRKFYWLLIGCILGFWIFYLPIFIWKRAISAYSPDLFATLIIATAVTQVISCVVLSIWSFRRQRELARQFDRETADKIPAKPVWEYRSRFELLGLPLVHLRVGGSLHERRRIVKAWIAMGDIAIGGLFSFGGLAIAPISVGGFAIGLVPWGGLAIGVVALGGCALGVWALGGLVIGWQSFGGCAIAWNAAMGGTAIAHDFAIGGMAQAAQANNALAREAIYPVWFFKYGMTFTRHLVWLNLLWVVPLIGLWQLTRKKNQRIQAS